MPYVTVEWRHSLPKGEVGEANRTIDRWILEVTLHEGNVNETIPNENCATPSTAAADSAVKEFQAVNYAPDGKDEAQKGEGASTEEEASQYETSNIRPCIPASFFRIGEDFLEDEHYREQCNLDSNRDAKHVVDLVDQVTLTAAYNVGHEATEESHHDCVDQKQQFEVIVALRLVRLRLQGAIFLVLGNIGENDEGDQNAKVAAKLLQNLVQFFSVNGRNWVFFIIVVRRGSIRVLYLVSVSNINGLHLQLVNGACHR